MKKTVQDHIDAAIQKTAELRAGTDRDAYLRFISPRGW